MKKVIAIFSISILFTLPISPSQAHNGVKHKTPKRGQFCPAAAIGHKDSGLICKSLGSRARWK